MKMLKTIPAAALVATVSVGAAMADEKKIKTDPFVGTQGELFGLAVAGGLTAVIVIVAADET